MDEAVNPKLAPHNEFSKCDEIQLRNTLFFQAIDTLRNTE